MRIHSSQRGQKKNNNHNLNNIFDEEIPFKKDKTEKKAKKRSEKLRFQNRIRQGIYDFEEDME
jgi:hypothetical protein